MTEKALKNLIKSKQLLFLLIYINEPIAKMIRASLAKIKSKLPAGVIKSN